MIHEDAGSGPAIVLLHGYPFDRTMWREQIVFLSDHGYRVVAPDLYGAPPYEPIRTMDTMAREVAALLDSLHIETAVICGLSMGAYVAFEFIDLFAERVMALILAGAKAQAADENERQSRQSQARQVITEGLEEVSQAMMPKLLAPATFDSRPDVISRLQLMIRNISPAAAAAAQRGMAVRNDYAAFLSEIAVPTLIIAGREDSIRQPTDAEFIRAGIGGSRMEIIGDAGHLMNLEQPQIFNQTVLELLGNLRS